MKITIESTTKIVSADGMDCRVWEGKTDKGVAVVCLIPRIAVRTGQDMTDFVAELEETSIHSVSPEAFPMRLIL